MSFLSQIASNYGYYVRLMIALAIIAYDDPMTSIPGRVEQIGMEVVWGPAEIGDGLDVSYTRAFIVHDPASDEYTVVIRGTNPLSLLSWTLEDFDVGHTVPFNTVAPNAPASALISQGTYNGLAYLVELRDTTGRTLVEYLQQVRPEKLFVTGHSLGGTLTPPMFAYINEMVYGGTNTGNMAPFSFAGLTPGNAAFNTYFSGLFDSGVQWRVHNTLDIAPYLWASLDSLQHVYTPNHLSWGWPESDWLSRKFSEAAPNGYMQPEGGQALTGVFDPGFVAEHLWMAQAAHQHHGCTYLDLIQQAFPASSTQVDFTLAARPVCPPSPPRR
jgi:hypothetical protein